MPDGPTYVVANSEYQAQDSYKQDKAPSSVTPVKVEISAAGYDSFIINACEPMPGVQIRMSRIVE